MSLLFVIALFTSTSLQAKELDIYVIPGGDSIGLQLSTGIYVTGKYEVKTADGEKSPWEKADIEVGDKIQEINNVAVSTIEDIQKILGEMKNNQDVLLKLQRQNQTIITVCEAIRGKNGKMTLGLYVKDEVLGVGTITYVNPKNNKFGALGHSIVQEELNDSSLGTITASSIHGIRKSYPGLPGEKQATLSKIPIGTIMKNSNIGVFGVVNDIGMFPENVMKVAMPDEVKLGKAEIWTVLHDNSKEKYDVEIVEIKKQSAKGIKGIKLHITDKDLLDKTGGIIQGMSGSPIIQNNQLIGAVSHVVIDSPDYGYGVYALWMINNF